MTAATIATTMTVPADVHWPSRQPPAFRTLESWSGHFCHSFLSQEEADAQCHRGFADWECEHGAIVWHYDLDAAAERARATEERLRPR